MRVVQVPFLAHYQREEGCSGSSSSMWFGKESENGGLEGVGLIGVYYLFSR